MEILFVSVFKYVKPPTVIRSSKLQCFDQLIAFTSSFPHIIKEEKKRVRHQDGISFLSQSNIGQKCVSLRRVPQKRAIVSTDNFLFMEQLPLDSTQYFSL